MKLTAREDYGKIQRAMSYNVVKQGRDYITVTVGGKPIVAYKWVFFDDEGNPYSPPVERERSDEREEEY